MSRYIPVSDRLILYGKSGRRCSMPECRANLIPEIAPDIETNIAENAHIIAFGEKGPRSNNTIEESEKNSYKNLLLVCATCHTIIDKNPKQFPVEKLLKIKEDHEKWVLNELNEEIQNIGFSELEDILKYLISEQITIKETYELINPTEKIKRNNLSPHVEQSILRGMIGSHQVKEYIEKHPDGDYGNRIRERFVNEYNQLFKNEKLVGDDMFYRLLDFASMKSNNPKKTGAGLSVLTYFFETCEVFEK